MKYNKGFIGIGVIVAIIAILAVGGGAYYLGTQKQSTEQDLGTSLNYENDIKEEQRVNQNNVAVNPATPPAAPFSWITLNANQSGIGEISYPSNWVTTPIYGTSIGTSNSILGITLKPATTGLESISLGGWQYDCSNVNVVGGNNPSTKAFCIQNISVAGVWSGVYITQANQGNVNGIPMITGSNDPYVLDMFDQIVQYNLQ